MNEYEDNDPGPAEPIWHGILKIAGIVGGVGIAIFGIIYFVVTMEGHMEKRHEDQRVQAMEEGNAGREVMLTDQKGSFMGYKMTYEGHDYLKASSQGGIVHSESCPCKNVLEEEKP